jgi:hypothetical protein
MKRNAMHVAQRDATQNNTQCDIDKQKPQHTERNAATIYYYWLNVALNP